MFTDLARHLSVHTEILVTTTDTAAPDNVRTKSPRTSIAVWSKKLFGKASVSPKPRAFRSFAVHHRRMAVTEDKVAECVAHHKKLLKSLPQPPQSLSQAPDSQLHVLVERAGGKRRSDALLAQLDQAFEDAGITTYPRLTDPDLESQDRVYILDTANPIKGLAPMRELFRDEKTLQEFIRTHHDWFPDLRKLGLHGFEEQVLLDSGVERLSG